MGGGEWMDGWTQLFQMLKIKGRLTIFQRLTPNNKEGRGVNRLMLRVAKKSGRCPCLAPTKYNLQNNNDYTGKISGNGICQQCMS